MELKKTNKSWSYRQGFKKGIEISNNNHSEFGYFADEENERTIKGFQKQISEGVDKNGVKLTYQQIEWRKGVVDGINYTYGKYGTSLNKKQESPFERYERLHNYGKPKPYTGTDYWE